jgi:maleate cis-trans isomerase
MTVRGSRTRIGFLWPVDGLNDDEYWDCLAPGVGWYTARYGAGTSDETLSVETIAAYAEPAVVARAVPLIATIRPDEVALGDVVASCFAGADGDREIRAAVRTAAGVPVASGLLAIRESLRVVGARRINLLLPYPIDLSERVEAAVAGCGVEVVVAAAAAETDEFGIGMTAPEVWAERAARVDDTAADAVVIAGGGVRIGRCIAALEARLGKPVIASPQALVWLATRLAGVDATVGGLGHLLQVHGRAEVFHE